MKFQAAVTLFYGFLLCGQVIQAKESEDRVRGVARHDLLDTTRRLKPSKNGKSGGKSKIESLSDYLSLEDKLDAKCAKLNEKYEAELEKINDEYEAIFDEADDAGFITTQVLGSCLPVEEGN